MNSREFSSAQKVSSRACCFAAGGAAFTASVRFFNSNGVGARHTDRKYICSTICGVVFFSASILPIRLPA